MVKKEKFKNCMFCKNSLEIHHITKHARICYLNPRNIRLIAQYFHQAVTDLEKLKRVQFYSYCTTNSILTPVTIMAKFGHKNFKHTIIQLLMYCHALDLMDYELIDYLLYFLTTGQMGLPRHEYLRIVNAMSQSDTFDSLEQNFTALYIAVIMRTKQDLLYNIGQNNENKEKITERHLRDSITFLMEASPAILSETVFTNKLSGDALRLYKEYVANPSGNTVL